MHLVFRLITSRRFYAGIVCMMIFSLLVSRSDVSSFSWVPSISLSRMTSSSDQSFVPNKQIREKAVAIVYTNILIGNEGASQILDVGSPEGNDVSKALFFTKLLQDTVRTDVVSLVRNSSERSVVLQSFLTQGDVGIKQATLTASHISQTITKHQLAL